MADVKWRRVVHNAVDPGEYQPVCPEEKGDYLMQLARISPIKGQHLAIEVAKRVGLKLVLAGKVDPDSADYFDREIKPHIGDLVTWHENVVGTEKAQLLAKARAMIFPIQWEEPFGLAMVEGVVRGAPAAASPRRARPLAALRPGVLVCGPGAGVGNHPLRYSLPVGRRPDCLQRRSVPSRPTQPGRRGPGAAACLSPKKSDGRHNGAANGGLVRQKRSRFGRQNLGRPDT